MSEKNDQEDEQAEGGGQARRRRKSRVQMAERQTAELKGSDEGSDARTHKLQLKPETRFQL